MLEVLGVLVILEVLEILEKLETLGPLEKRESLEQLVAKGGQHEQDFRFDYHALPERGKGENCFCHWRGCRWRNRL